MIDFFNSLNHRIKAIIYIASFAIGAICYFSLCAFIFLKSYGAL